MRRTIVKSARMGEEYLRLEHESGLVVLFYPMKGFRTAYAIFGTKYGSVDSEFKTPEDEDFVKVPDGVAHYLEHKLFESEEGSVDRLFAGAGACLASASSAAFFLAVSLAMNRITRNRQIATMRKSMTFWINAP